MARAVACACSPERRGPTSMTGREGGATGSTHALAEPARQAPQEIGGIAAVRHLARNVLGSLGLDPEARQGRLLPGLARVPLRGQPLAPEVHPAQDGVQLVAV